MQVGQTEKFKVIKVNSSERKLGLSLRTSENPKRAVLMEEHKPQIKKEIKRYRIPAVSPEYMRFIFRLE